MAAETGSMARSGRRPRSGPAARVCAYLALVKAPQTLLLLATGLSGYASGRPGGAPLTTVAPMLLSLLAAIGGTTALNMAADGDLDARMARTAARPLPMGQLSRRQAAAFGSGLVVQGLALAFWLGTQFGAIVGAGVAIDLVVYTLWLKRRSPWAILFGGVAGGMPVLAGRALATGRLDGPGLVLALSVVLWIPSHVMTLSIKYADDYRRAGVPTWPNYYGFAWARRFIAASTGLAAASLTSAGCLLAIPAHAQVCLALLSVGILGLSIWAMVRPSASNNSALFKGASLYMLLATATLTLGAMW